MSAPLWETDIASLKGSYTQISDRLNSIDARLGDHTSEFRAVRNEMASEFRAVRNEMTSQFRWMLGIVFGSWVTLLSAILAHR
jgi:hypothetical protein